MLMFPIGIGRLDITLEPAVIVAKPMGATCSIDFIEPSNYASL
jgi:hypothetical protein